MFIGKKLDKAQLIKDFEACKAEDNLRFTVGDKVLAAYGFPPAASGQVADGMEAKAELGSWICARHGNLSSLRPALTWPSLSEF